MTDSKHTLGEKCEIFDLDTDHNFKNSGRKSIRYVRSDIRVQLVSTNVLSIAKKIDAQLLDVSSKGIRISTDEKLSVGKKLTVKLYFDDGEKFTITAKVVRQDSSNRQHFGLKFDKQENVLADYLLQTQTDLVFK
ncbi:MAG: hypothetical protein Kow0065_14490 [Methylomicrobium sp.]